MGTELISAVVDESGTRTYDLAVTRVVAGDVERIRAGLVEAFERLGYHIVEERPLVAKRRTTPWGAWGCGTNPLEVPTTVHVRLQAATLGTTRATFSYTIRSSWFSRGDRHLFAREADAAVALAMSSDDAGACMRCGTDAVPDSRFCRRCGAPLATYEPAELETLRLAAGVNAGAKSVGTGVTFVLVGLLLFALMWFLPSLLSNPAKLAKLTVVLTTFIWAAGAMGIVSLVRGYFQMRSTLDRGAEREVAPAVSRSDRLASPPTGRLAPAPEYISVTENTTELLEAERAPRKSDRTTGEVN